MAYLSAGIVAVLLAALYLLVRQSTKAGEAAYEAKDLKQERDTRGILEKRKAAARGSLGRLGAMAAGLSNKRKR